MLITALLGVHALHAALAAPLAQSAPAPLPAPVEVAPASVPEPVLFAAVSDEEVFAHAVAAIEAIDTLRARFEQISAAGNVTTGMIAMDRPGRLRFDYDAPSAQRIVATGGLVYVHDADLETTDSYPLGKTPLRFLLSEDVAAADAELIGVSRAPGQVIVGLRAAGEELSGEVALVFEGTEDALMLSRWVVVDPQGGVTEVALSDMETGIDLSRRLFRIPETQRRFGSGRR